MSASGRGGHPGEARPPGQEGVDPGQDARPGLAPGLDLPHELEVLGVEWKVNVGDGDPAAAVLDVDGSPLRVCVERALP